MEATKQLKVRTNYNYTPLNKCDVGDTVNFYGVILDATFPHSSYNKQDKFICSLKVTDNSLGVNEKGEADFVSLVFFASHFDQLPICQRVGDLIRVHRATVGVYKDKKQISVNICFNSSWALFPAVVPKSTEESKAQTEKNTYYPVAFSSKQVSVEKDERDLIKTLRNWTSN